MSKSNRDSNRLDDLIKTLCESIQVVLDSILIRFRTLRGMIQYIRDLVKNCDKIYDT